MTPQPHTPGAGRAAKGLPFLLWWREVNRETLRADAFAGLIGAIIVLPQGIAFATLAGMPPEYGLYAAMVPAVIAALFGSSWHLVSGPTNVVSIAVFASVSMLAVPGSPEYIRLVLTLTLLTGVMQLAMGLARLGGLVNFISHTVIVSFTAGAACLIVAAQIGGFFGMETPRGASVPATVHHFLAHLEAVNPWTTAVGTATVATGLASRRLWPRFPYMIAAIAGGVATALALKAAFGAAAGTIAIVGDVPASLPRFSPPDLSLDSIRKTLSIAFAVTLLGLTEAVSIARAIAIKSGQRLDGSREFIGQGLSNIAGSFFSAYAASGSFNRSGANYEAGARTPLAAIFSAVLLVALLYAVGPLVGALPLAVVAGILFLVAWGLFDFVYIRAVLRTSRQESAVMLITFCAALFADIEFAIYAGVLMSLTIYLTRTSRPLVLDVKPDPAPDSYHFTADSGLPDCPQLKMIRVNGSLFYGAVDHVRGHMEAIEQKHLLIAASGINFVDMAGAEMLAQEARRRRRMGGGLYFYRVKDAVRGLLARGGYLQVIGEDNLFPVKTRPVSSLYRRLDPEICRHCRVRIFRQCHASLPNGEPVPPPAAGSRSLG